MSTESFTVELSYQIQAIASKQTILYNYTDKNKNGESAVILGQESC